MEAGGSVHYSSTVVEAKPDQVIELKTCLYTLALRVCTFTNTARI
jgi:hypothetical protein